MRDLAIIDAQRNAPHPQRLDRADDRIDFDLDPLLFSLRELLTAQQRNRQRLAAGIEHPDVGKIGVLHFDQRRGRHSHALQWSAGLSIDRQLRGIGFQPIRISRGRLAAGSDQQCGDAQGEVSRAHDLASTCAATALRGGKGTK